MHYAPVFSNFLVTSRVRSRPTVQDTVIRHYHVRAGSWRNWWNMSVADPEAGRSPTARSIGARGRLPGI